MNPRDAQTRAENVGSFLRSPEALRAASARAGASRNPDPEAVAALDAAVLDVIKLQREAGVDIVTDGELRRSNWADTPDYLDCFDKIVGNTGGLRWRGGASSPAGGHAAAYDTVARRVADAKRLGDRSAQYAFLAEHADVRTKFTLPAPSYHRRYWWGEVSGAGRQGHLARASGGELMADLAGKVAIVTGGAQGIGRAIVAELAVSGGELDVTDEASIAALVDATARAHGGVDILVNNAGLFATLRRSGGRHERPRAQTRGASSSFAARPRPRADGGRSARQHVNAAQRRNLGIFSLGVAGIACKFFVPCKEDAADAHFIYIRRKSFPLSGTYRLIGAAQTSQDRIQRQCR